MSRRKQTAPRASKSETSGFKPIKLVGRTDNQKLYIKTVSLNDITFAVGPAGSGKTHIAMGLAAISLRERKIERIVLSRPAVDAGASLGYLPGTMEEKMAPYLAPLYDELSYFIELKSLMAWMEHKVVEIVPLSLMRGRTFNNAFIILDEAQNATLPELRMALTRIGMNSKMVVTGDLSQSDLKVEAQGGLLRCVRNLCAIDGIGVIELGDSDIIRHPLIAKIESALSRSTASCSRAKKDKPS